MKGVLGALKGCRLHNGVFRAEMRCWLWGERVFGVLKVVFGELKVVFGAKRVFRSEKRCLGA